jgi:hypothetical protein
MAPTIISRAEAKAAGLKRYFTGKPCPYGHVAERLRSNGLCAKCLSIRAARLIKAQRAAMPLDELRAKRATEAREWRRRDPERAAAHDKRMAARPGRKAYHRQWNRQQRQTNGNHVRARDRAAQARKLLEDVQYRLRLALRTRLNIAIKHGSRAGSAVRDLGCTIAAFKIWIEAQFEPGMSWDNWGRDTWHLDHIKPLADFDLTDRTQFLTACHYTNMRPLWAEDNLARRFYCVARPTTYRSTPPWKGTPLQVPLVARNTCFSAI